VFIKKSELLGGKSGGCSSGGCCGGGDSLRSRMKGRHGGCHQVVEEIYQPAPPIIVPNCPPPPKPCPPPQIVILPQNPPPAPQINKEDKSNRDVIVYAPQYIEANKRNTKVDYNDADKYAYDNRPDNRIYYDNDERFMYDGRQDNRINYNRQHYRNDDYRSDNRRFDNHEDNRNFDYRADNRSNREDNRHYNRQMDYWSNREDNRKFDYRADNRSNFMANHQASAYGGGDMYDPEYDIQRAQDEAFQLGYYDAQAQEYNRYLAEDCDDDGYGGYYGEYLAQPGYTDDYGGEASYVQYMPPEPQGHFELVQVPEDEYVYHYTGGRPAGGQGGQYIDAANGLGYYP
jgi:hypothetical protein